MAMISPRGTLRGPIVKVMDIEAQGPHSSMVVRDVADVWPSAHEVQIEVAAAGVNRADLMQRAGYYPPPQGAPAWPGLEVSGRIGQIGSEVSNWSPGDEVCALLAGGGYAEQVCVDERLVLPVPSGVGVLEAASLPEAACTVWSNLVMAARLAEGDTALIHGGSSGIGTMAVQVAAALGATVAVTAGSAHKLAVCRELGAAVLINYREQDFVQELQAATSGRGADVILDSIGAKYLARNVAALAPGGRCVVIGLLGGRRAELDLGELLTKRAAVMATSLRSRSLAEKAEIVAQVRRHVWPLIETGRVHPAVDSTFALDQAQAAHDRMESSQHVGKLLLTIG